MVKVIIYWKNVTHTHPQNVSLWVQNTWQRKDDSPEEGDIERSGDADF